MAPFYGIISYLAFNFCIRHDFQFFNNQRLNELYEKEVRYLMVFLIQIIIIVICTRY
jgi:hypothetical protein